MVVREVMGNRGGLRTKWDVIGRRVNVMRKVMERGEEESKV